MICPNCHNENREGARFCDACGTPLLVELPTEEEPLASDAEDALAANENEAEGASESGDAACDDAACARDAGDRTEFVQDDSTAGNDVALGLELDSANQDACSDVADDAAKANTKDDETSDTLPNALDKTQVIPAISCDADLGAGSHEDSGEPAKQSASDGTPNSDNAKNEDDSLDRTMRLPALDGLPEIEPSSRSGACDPDMTCDLTESLAGADFTPPKPDWHDGGTMQMPVIKDAPAKESHDFRASATVEQKHGARKVAIIVGAIIVAALAVAAIVAYQTEAWGGKIVPDVSGMTQSEATEVLESKGFTVRATSVKSDDAEGYVLLEDPEADSRQPEGSEVVIHITVPRSMPDVVGKSIDDAKALIAAEDLSNVTYTVVNSDEDEGTVLSASVDAGTRVKGATAIEIEVAKPYTVPDISGQSLTEAERSINAEGLSYQVVYTYTEQYSDGTILGTTPAAGEKVKGGSLVSINVTKTRSTELLAATRSLLASGSTVTVGGVSYTVSSLDSVSYIGGNQTSFTMTATPFVSLFGEKLSGTSRSVSGTITWTDDNDVSSISS